MHDDDRERPPEPPGMVLTDLSAWMDPREVSRRAVGERNRERVVRRKRRPKTGPRSEP